MGSAATSTGVRLSLYVAEDLFAVLVEYSFVEHVFGDELDLLPVRLPVFAPQTLAKLHCTRKSCIHDKDMSQSKGMQLPRAQIQQTIVFEAWSCGCRCM